MVEGYANVSITDLQAALNMGRGTLYYYFKDKDELFQEVVNTYLIQPKQRALDRVKEGATIPDMIEAMLYYLNQLKEFYDLVENKTINTSNVVTMMYTAYSRFPELYKNVGCNCLRKKQQYGIIYKEKNFLRYLHVTSQWRFITAWFEKIIRRR